MHKIAVLLAAYNGRNTICEQINSIINQVGVDVSIFISVDRSSDGTEELITELSSKYSMIHVLEFGHVFGSAGLNFFHLITNVYFSKFDYCAFSDQDDIWYERKLIDAVEKIKEKNINLYSSNVTAFWSDGREMLIDKAQPQQKWDYFFEAAGPGCTYVIQSDVANKLKDYLVSSKEVVKNIEMHDWFIYAWARNKGFRWFIDENPSMHYRQHSTNVVGVNNGFVAAKSRFNKLCNGWYLKQIMLTAHAIGALDQPPIIWVNNPSMTNKCKLLVSVFHCRRRLRDQLAFIVFIFMLSNSKKK